MNSICLNGKMVTADQPVLLVSNKSYRYGDGLFETMKVYRDGILLDDYHFERFFSGLQLLRFEIPSLLTVKKLKTEILQLCEKNNCSQLARVRLAAFRGNGGVYEGSNDLHYTIECWPLEPTVNQLNENGLTIGIYTEAQKSCDVFSALKSANYLPYVMAAQYARENKWNDCLVMNVHGRMADATIANLFIIKDKTIQTPPLTEGGVNGVMRRYLLPELQLMGYPVRETPVSPADIEQADELFLTNAISGIRWVKQCGNTSYSNTQTTKIYNSLLKPFWS